MTETEIKNIFPEELKIDPKKGFDEHDIFGWKQQGEALIDLLNSTNQQMVLGLDAQWGSGKTTFLQMLAGELRNKNGHLSVIYFDAFEVDYMEEPFIALVGEILNHIDGVTFRNEGLNEQFTVASLQVAKVVASGILKASAKTFSMGVIDEIEIKKLTKEWEKQKKTNFENQFSSAIDAYKNKKEGIEHLKTVLSKVSHEILNFQPKPLVFIIDELDRCRPDFALRILEQIKHLFSTPNVHFILSADFKQLGAMVKNAYGNDYDAVKYFDKFRDYTFILKHQDQVLNYLNVYCSKTPLEKCSHDDNSFFKIYLERLHAIHGLSLRDLQKILNVISVNHKRTNNNETNDAVYIALVSMKIINPELFFKAKCGGLKIEDFDKFYALGEVELDNHISEIIRFWIYGHFDIVPDEEALENNSFLSRTYELAHIKHRKNEKQIIEMCSQLSSC